jgi:hypothetical protein
MSCRRGMLCMSVAAKLARVPICQYVGTESDGCGSNPCALSCLKYLLLTYLVPDVCVFQITMERLRPPSIHP